MVMRSRLRWKIIWTRPGGYGVILKCSVSRVHCGIRGGRYIIPERGRGRMLWRGRRRKRRESRRCEFDPSELILPCCDLMSMSSLHGGVSYACILYKYLGIISMTYMNTSSIIHPSHLPGADQVSLNSYLPSTRSLHSTSIPPTCFPSTSISAFITSPCFT